VRRVKLNRQEREIENALVRGEYVNVSEAEFATLAQAIVRRRKDAVLNIRVNSDDLKSIKRKAKRLGVKYQTFISELLHRIARS
jgi:predicted DNA binding CopG/RHH family protein